LRHELLLLLHHHLLLLLLLLLHLFSRHVHQLLFVGNKDTE
jgi:hypothetical protein